ncbi:MAG: glutamate--cysteine ligase, chloroplastic-like [Bacteriovoracaceae bacterium]|nr:glutamate--cysteine ligase, chloroplastic-like [Bacteriovoracaceae bacterium]
MPEVCVNAICELLKNHPRSENRWIGIEVERLMVGANNKVLHYRDSMEPLLNALKNEKKWAVDYESDGHLLGIKRNLHAISLEPGAQFEVSAAPRKTIQEVKKVADEIDAEIFSLPMTKGWKFLEIGVNPFEDEKQIELLPSPRYKLMDSYFQKIPPANSGPLPRRGREMMRLTTGLQVNLDFSSESEAVSMLRAAFWVTPILATLFSNSPYRHKRVTGNLSERHQIWRATDPLRSGFPAFIFQKDLSLKTYAEYISKIPLMYYFDADGHAVDPKGKAFVDLPNELKKKTALSCMRQLFAEVRLKPCCVEVRCFDQQTDAERYAAVALTVGLLYDDENRSLIQQKFKDVKAETLSKWMDEGSKKGLKVEPLYELSLEFLRLAEKGLERRGFNEVEFLKPVEEIIKSTFTPAEKLLKKWGEELG